MSLNLILYSEDFTNSVWNQIDTVSSNVALSPTGTLTADKLEEMSVGNNYAVQPITLSINPSEQHIFSVYLKLTGTDEGNGNVKIRLSRVGGTFEVFSVTAALTSSWQRFSVVSSWVFAHTGVLAVLQHVSGGPSEIHVWGAQFESGAIAGPYSMTEGVPTSAFKNSMFLVF